MDPGQRATYDLPYAREYLQHVYIHEARWCMKYVHIIETRYALACEHKKRSKITRHMRFFWSRRNSSGAAVLRTPKNMTGLGVR